MLFSLCFYSRSARTGDDIREIRNILDTSLTNVARDPNLDSILLEQEARKLDESLGGMQARFLKFEVLRARFIFNLTSNMPC